MHIPHLFAPQAAKLAVQQQEVEQQAADLEQRRQELKAAEARLQQREEVRLAGVAGWGCSWHAVWSMQCT